MTRTGIKFSFPENNRFLIGRKKVRASLLAVSGQDTPASICTLSINKDLRLS